MKKKILFIICLVCFSIHASAQIKQSFSVSFHRFFVSTNNLNLFYSQQNGKKEWSIGLKYHFNENIGYGGHIMQMNMYSDKLYQNIGLVGEYRKYLWNETNEWTKFVNPYFVFHMAVSFKELRREGYFYNLASGSYEPFIYRFGPYLITDNDVGIGLKFFPREKMSLFVQAGGGLAFAFGTPTGDILRIPNTYWEYSHMYGGGITYNFNTKPRYKKDKMRRK
ncbi:MAG: hypothetical protein RL757_496 [Bacteroidota bacterium]|jgi:hypothetical protein